MLFAHSQQIPFRVFDLLPLTKNNVNEYYIFYNKLGLTNTCKTAFAVRNRSLNA